MNVTKGLKRAKRVGINGKRRTGLKSEDDMKGNQNGRKFCRKIRSPRRKGNGIGSIGKNDRSSSGIGGFRTIGVNRSGMVGKGMLTEQRSKHTGGGGSLGIGGKSGAYGYRRKEPWGKVRRGRER